MPDIICLGEVIVDMIAMDPDAGLGGTRGFYKFPGGATANVAVGICRMGGQSGFLGAQADDHFGRYLMDAIKKEGVDVSRMNIRPGEISVIGFLSVKSDQTKEVIFYRDPSSEIFLKPEEIDSEYFQSAKIFHFGIICMGSDARRETTRKCLKVAKENGCLVSLDVNYRPHAWPSHETARRYFYEALEHVDILKIADEEWPLLFENEWDKRGEAELLDKGVKIIVISEGIRGATLVTPDVRISVPAFNINSIETTGAGDAFTASSLSSIVGKLKEGSKIYELDEDDWREILRKANAAGGLACTKPGAIPAIPTMKEIESLLEESS